MAEPKDTRIGAVLEGRYRVLERIAAGGMGSVYRGERLQLGRQVAIKFLHSWVAGHPDMIERFNREARAMSRLSHPTCVLVIDFGVHEGVPYLVMDFVSGRTLKAVLAAEGRIAPPRAIAIVKQLLAGLAHAHGQGIVHRDVKPDNVLLGEVTGLGVHVRILDFGVAKLRDLQSGLTVGMAIGTPSYMAPEQTRGEPVDARTDVYAVGAVLFEALTGRKLFDAETSLAVILMQREKAPPRLRDAVPGGHFSRELEAVIVRALAKAPGDRFQSAAEFAAALAATPEAQEPAVSAGGLPAAKEEPPASPPPAAAVVGRKGQARRSPLPTVAASVLVVGGLVGAWIYLTGPGKAARDEGVERRSAAEGAEEPDEEPDEAPDEAPVEAPPTPAPKPAASERPKAPPAEPPPAQVDRGTDVQGLAEARALARQGSSRRVIDKLRALRKRHPQHAEIAYLLANAYLSELWGEEGFETARAAVRLDPRYRRDPTLIENAVNALVSDRHGGRAMRFIREEIGEAAIPALEKARKSRSLNVSRRADQLLRSLKPRR